MATYKFISVRLGKDSIAEIDKLCAAPSGVLQERFNITVRCTQIPEGFDTGDYAFIWLGSNNNKGMPTKWKQGFKAVGVVKDVQRGKKYNDTSETNIEIVYTFLDSVNRLDILRNASSAYYWCSSMPLIGIDDHANQTIRNMSGETFCDIRAFFCAMDMVTSTFKKDIVSVNPDFMSFFMIRIPSPKKYPTIKSIKEIDFKRTNTLQEFSIFRPYITAIKSKPFLLLAGISGTGKSRIVRELARACWDEGTEEYNAQKPKNFQMVQVKPNWHDSSDLIGYVSRVSGKAEYVAGDFLRFVAKAWEDKDTPYFLCLDEMNLAPVEQYFAEYLSVVESRKSHEDGTVTTDPILEKVDEEWYFNLTASLTTDENVRKQFNESGISIPQNLIVVGTVNMDETTFSFSRKVLDRAMTIEMNEVDLHGGLTERNEQIGKLGKAELIGNAVEGVDVYTDNKEVCEKVLTYLDAVNAVLNGTPFKVAYRTRNEFLLYVVNNLPYNKDENDTELEQGYVIARALDEITSMKVLSRIEGDDTKVSDAFIDRLSKTIDDGLKAVSGEEYAITSISLAKLKEMKAKLASGYTSFWS